MFRINNPTCHQWQLTKEYEMWEAEADLRVEIENREIWQNIRTVHNEKM